MIDLAKFKNIEGNEKNRAEITQIGILPAIDAYFEGDTTFSEEQLIAMVEFNLTKVEISEQLRESSTEDQPNTEQDPQPEPEPTPDPTPDQTEQGEQGEGEQGQGEQGQGENPQDGNIELE